MAVDLFYLSNSRLSIAFARYSQFKYIAFQPNTVYGAGSWKRNSPLDFLFRRLLSNTAILKLLR